MQQRTELASRGWKVHVTPGYHYSFTSPKGVHCPNLESAWSHLKHGVKPPPKRPHKSSSHAPAAKPVAKKPIAKKVAKRNDAPTAKRSKQKKGKRARVGKAATVNEEEVGTTILRYYDRACEWCSAKVWESARTCIPRSTSPPSPLPSHHPSKAPLPPPPPPSSSFKGFFAAIRHRDTPLEETWVEVHEP